MDARVEIEPIDGEEDGAKADVDAETPDGAISGTESAGGHEEADQQGEEEEGEPIRRLPCPGAPSTAERLAHEMTHWPCRSWCEWCVRGPIAHAEGATRLQSRKRPASADEEDGSHAPRQAVIQTSQKANMRMCTAERTQSKAQHTILPPCCWPRTSSTHRLSRLQR